MMPCKLCTKLDASGIPTAETNGGKVPRGLKQIGKTKRADRHWKNKYGEATAKDAKGERFYVCQDCGARWRMTFDTVDKTHATDPMFELIPGGLDD